MCWSHVYRNLVPKMSSIKKVNQKLQQQLLVDIQDLQWSCHSESTFCHKFDLLEQKYTKGCHEKQEKTALVEFFSYIREQWGPESHVSKWTGYIWGYILSNHTSNRWYEGAHPWGVSNNQGIEGTNKAIKASHTFKRWCNLRDFMNIVDRLVSMIFYWLTCLFSTVLNLWEISLYYFLLLQVKEWSERDDCLLFAPRTDMLFKVWYQ